MFKMYRRFSIPFQAVIYKNLLIVFLDLIYTRWIKMPPILLLSAIPSHLHEMCVTTYKKHPGGTLYKPDVIRRSRWRPSFQSCQNVTPQIKRRDDSSSIISFPPNKQIRIYSYACICCAREKNKDRSVTSPEKI